jgi:hypothetical protein
MGRRSPNRDWTRGVLERSQIRSQAVPHPHEVHALDQGTPARDVCKSGAVFDAAGAWAGKKLDHIDAQRGIFVEALSIQAPDSLGSGRDPVWGYDRSV